MRILCWRIILLVFVSFTVGAFTCDKLSPRNNFGLRKTTITVDATPYTKIFDPLNILNRISYRVEDGVLNFRVFVAPSKDIFSSRINGQMLFDAMWEDLLKKNIQIIGIRGNWEDKDERRDNLKIFNQFHNRYFNNSQFFNNLKKSRPAIDTYGQHILGYSKMQFSALLTWTGKMAVRKGFTKVEIIKMNKNYFSDDFNRVEVIFYESQTEFDAFVWKSLNKNIFISS